MNPKRLQNSPASPDNFFPCTPQKQQVQNCIYYLKQLEYLIYNPEGEKELEMDWINCNSCCRQPGDEKERSFVLTSCGHLFCDLCLSKESRDKCPACASKCQLIQLSSKMKPDAEMFFQEPAALIKKHFTQINRLLEFQKDHRIRLVSFHRKMLQKYKSLEEKHSTTTGEIKEMERRFSAANSRIQELESENQRLRSLIQDRGAHGGMPSTPLDHQSRILTPKNPSPKHSPGGAARISPHRLTLVKSGSVGRVGPPGPGPSGLPSGGTPVTYGGPMQHSPAHYPPHTQAFHRPSQVPHPHHTMHDGQSGVPPGAHPGGGYYRSFSPAHSRNPSPTRSAQGSLNHPQMLGSQPHHPSPIHKPPFPSQPPPFPHPPSTHHSFPPQGHPSHPYPHGSMSSVLASPDHFAKPHQGPMGFKKFSM